MNPKLPVHADIADFYKQISFIQSLYLSVYTDLKIREIH